MKIPRSLVPAVRSLIRPFSFSFPVTVNGRRFKTRFIKGIGYGNIQVAEPWMLDLLKRLVALCPTGGLLDVGVNIGQTLLKFRSIDPSRLYYGFEPNPFCVSFVQELIEVNRFSQCSVFPAALSDRAGLVGFDARTVAAADGTMRPHARLQDFRQYIAALVFDDLQLERLDEIAIVKVDVEGAELHVLRGMRTFLSERRPLLICEVLHAHDDAALSAATARNASLMQLLGEIGFATHRIVKGAEGVRALQSVEAFPAKTWFGPTSPAECDYLMVPRERTAEVRGAFGLLDDEAPAEG